MLLHYFNCGLLNNLNESTLLSSIPLASRTIQWKSTNAIDLLVTYFILFNFLSHTTQTFSLMISNFLYLFTSNVWWKVTFAIEFLPQSRSFYTSCRLFSTFLRDLRLPSFCHSTGRDPLSVDILIVCIVTLEWLWAVVQVHSKETTDALALEKVLFFYIMGKTLQMNPYLLTGSFPKNSL